MNDDARKKNDSATKMLLAVTIAIGAVALVALFIGLSMTEKKKEADSMQAIEAKDLLELLKGAMLDENKLKDSMHIAAIQQIREGATIREFSTSFDLILDGIVNLDYYELEDFVFHKGGGHKSNGLEFYIEAKSSRGHTPDGKNIVDQDLVFRLYSDGTIERIEL